MAADEFVVITSLAEESDGVIVHIEWFDSDPDEDRRVQPTLVDHVRVPAKMIADVTPDMVDDAIAAKREERRRARERRSAAGVRPDVQRMIGHARAFDGAKTRRQARRGE